MWVWSFRVWGLGSLSHSSRQLSQPRNPNSSDLRHRFDTPPSSQRTYNIVGQRIEKLCNIGMPRLGAVWRRIILRLWVCSVGMRTYSNQESKFGSVAGGWCSKNNKKKNNATSKRKDPHIGLSTESFGFEVFINPTQAG